MNTILAGTIDVVDADVLQSACAGADNVTWSLGREIGPVFFKNLKSHCFGPAKHLAAFQP
ncbi:MAG: hypothetical protein COB65_12790 [Thalassobium sp.]|nr:MAG: hypothetical protein COB65_12790 [Thalassobium sp.]